MTQARSRYRQRARQRVRERRGRLDRNLDRHRRRCRRGSRRTREPRLWLIPPKGNAVDDSFAVGDGPSSVAVDPAGTVWVASSDDGSVCASRSPAGLSGADHDRLVAGRDSRRVRPRVDESRRAAARRLSPSLRRRDGVASPAKGGCGEAKGRGFAFSARGGSGVGGRSRPAPGVGRGRGAEGRHAAARAGPRTSTPSTRRSRTRRVVADRVRDVREAVQLPGRAGCGGDARVPEVVDRFTVSQDGRTYTFELKRTFRFHTGARGDGAELRGRVQPGRRTRGSSRRRRAYMREIVGAAAVIDGKAQVDLGRPRARPLPAADPADQAGRRLHRPADDAVLLPDPAEHADRPGRDRQSGRLGPVLRRRAGPQPADRAEAQPVTTAATGPANVDQIVWTIGESAEACLLAVEQDRIDHLRRARASLASAYRRLAEKYGINRPGGQFFVEPVARDVVSSPSTTTGRRSRGRARSR